MAFSKSELLLHPIRLRIVLAMGAERRTTNELQALLPQVSQATLYRQIATLFKEGVLEVAEENRNRGGVERSYQLAAGGVAQLGSEDVAGMTMEDHLSALVTFAGAIIESMTRYAEHPGARPSTQPFGYHQVALSLTADEAESFTEDLEGLIDRYAKLPACEDRTRLTLSTISIPELDSPNPS